MSIKPGLFEIIWNAVKHTLPGEGKIALDAEIIGSEMVEADWKVSIRISDNGFGIPTDSLPFIFERYYQELAERSLGLESEGTGLGLAITKEIILLHSGTIEVESEIGKGTLFTIELPLRANMD